MTFVLRTDRPADRLRDYYQPISQFTKCEYTLDCIDCHTRTEAMGDGDIHSSKKEIQYIRCQTCHGTPSELPIAKTLTDPNDIAFHQARLNPVVELKLGDTVLVTDKGEPLWNAGAAGWLLRAGGQGHGTTVQVSPRAGIRLHPGSHSAGLAVLS